MWEIYVVEKYPNTLFKIMFKNCVYIVVVDIETALENIKLVIWKFPL